MGRKRVSNEKAMNITERQLRPTAVHAAVGLLCISTLLATGIGYCASPIRYIGAFTNVRYTAEHAYGYTVQLWRQGDGLIGLLLDAQGSQADVPTGLLEEVRFDPARGTLSFKAKLSI